MTTLPIDTRIKLKTAGKPVYNRLLLQEKRWWGWHTIDWQYEQPIGVVLNAMGQEITELEVEVSDMAKNGGGL